jgi:4-amino-4-deoxy-L-arabinose transferase-like glycosyltransferase
LRLSYIVTIGLGLRIIWVIAVPLHPVSDGVVYDLFAQRLAAGLGYTWPDGQPTAYWPIGTSAIYAVVYGVFGHSYVAAKIVNVVIGTLFIVAVYALTRTRFDRHTSRLAALLVAIWPTWISFTSILSSELPSNLLMTAGMAMVMSGRLSLVVRTILGCALLVGASFVRPTVLPLVLAVPVFDAMVSKTWRAALVGGIASVAVATAALAPWAARNYAIFGLPVLISANFGANLWMGNNAASKGGYMPLPAGLPKNEAVRDTLLKRRAVSYILKNPRRYIELCARRAAMSFDHETIGVTWNQESLKRAIMAPLKLLMSVYWLGLFALFLVGMGFYIWRQPLHLLDPLVIAVGLFSAVAVLVVGMDRYHFGLAPFVAAFAAHTLIRWSSSRGGSGSPVRQPLAARLRPNLALFLL